MDHIVLAAAEGETHSPVLPVWSEVILAAHRLRDPLCAHAQVRRPELREDVRRAHGGDRGWPQRGRVQAGRGRRQARRAREAARRRPARGCAHPRGGARAGCRDHRRDAGAGPGRVHPHRRARQDADRGRAPAGGHLAPCRGRRPRDRPGRSHRRARASTTRLARAAWSTGSSPSSRRRTAPPRGASTDDARSVCRRLRRSRRGPSGLRRPRPGGSGPVRSRGPGPLRAGPAPRRHRRVAPRRGQGRPAPRRAHRQGLDRGPRRGERGGLAALERRARPARRPRAARRRGRGSLDRQRRRPPRGRDLRGGSARAGQPGAARRALRPGPQPRRQVGAWSAACWATRSSPRPSPSCSSRCRAATARSRWPSPAYQKVAAEVRGQGVATVRVARRSPRPSATGWPRALARTYGREVHLNVIVDPDVIGGIRVEIGDDVIDGTVSSRLDEAGRRLAG